MANQRFQWIIDLDFNVTDIDAAIAKVEKRFNNLEARTGGTAPFDLQRSIRDVGTITGQIDALQKKIGEGAGLLPQNEANRMLAFLKDLQSRATLLNQELAQFGKNVTGPTARGVAASRNAANKANELFDGDSEKEFDPKEVANARRKALSEEAAVLRELRSTGEYSKTVAKVTSLKKQLEAVTVRELAADNAYIKATAEVAGLRKAMQLRQEKLLLGGSQYENVSFEGKKLGATNDANELARRRMAGIQAQIAQDAENDFIRQRQDQAKRRRIQNQQERSNYAEEEGKLNAQRTVIAARRAAAESKALVENTKDLQQLVQRDVAQRQLNAALRKRVSIEERAIFNAAVASGAGPEVVGTRFQRFQAALASRGGDFRAPTEFATGGQFLKNKFLSTAGFALSGIATFGAFSAISQAVTDANELEKTLSLIQGQFEATDRAAAFPGFRDAIIQISTETGEAADEVARIALQFRGAFQDMSDDQVTSQVQSAVEIARVTGLSLKEITDSLTAAALNYGTTVEHIGDVALTLQNRTGVLASEIIASVGDLAPVAQQAGLSIEEALTLVAKASQTSARQPAAITEAFGRVLPSIQENAGAIIQLYKEIDPSRVESLISSLAGGQTGDVFFKIAEGFTDLSTQEQNRVAALLGSRRETQNIIGVLKDYASTREALNEAERADGTVSEQFARRQQTLSAAIDKVRAAFRSFAATLLRAGISDAVQTLAEAFAMIINTGGGIVKIFADFNEAAAGLPAKLLLVTLALTQIVKLLQAMQGFSISKAFATTGVGQAFAGGLGGTAASAVGNQIGMRADGTPILAAASYQAAAGQASRRGFLSTLRGGAAKFGPGGPLFGTTVTLAGVAAYTGYQTIRDKFDADMRKRVDELVEKDEKDLREAVENSKLNSTGDTIRNTLFGTDTSHDVAQEALARKRAPETTKFLEQVIAGLDERDQKLADDLGNAIQDVQDDPSSDRAEAVTFLNTYKDKLSALPPGLVDILLTSVEYGSRDDLYLAIHNFQNSDGRKGNLDEAKKLEEAARAADGARAKDLQAQADAILNSTFGPGASDFSYPGFGEGATTSEQIQAAIDDLQAAAGGMEGSGGPAETLTGFITDNQVAFIALAKVIAGEYSTLEEALAGEQAKIDALAEVQAAQDTYEIAVAKYKAGIGTQADVNRLLDAAIQTQRDIIASPEFQGLDDASRLKIYQDLAGLIGDQTQTAVDNLEARYNRRAEGLARQGKSTGEVESARQADILRILGANPEAPFEARQAAAEAFVESQQAWLEFAQSNAETDAEAAAIVAQGLETPEEIKAIQIEGNLRTLTGSTEEGFAAIANALGTNIQAVMGIAATMTAANKDFIATIERILRKMLANLLIASEQIQILKGSPLFKGASDYINRQIQAVAAAIDGLPDVEEGLQAAQQGIGDTTSIEPDNNGEKAKDEAREIAEAQLEVLLARAEQGRDTLRVAQIGVEQADVAIKFAETTAERLQAQAQKIRAETALKDALFELYDSQIAILIAGAEAAGDGVKAADLKVEQLNTRIQDLKKNGANRQNSAELNNLEAELISAQAQARDERLSKSVDDIEFELEMGQITNAQAISRLQALIDSGQYNQQQTRELQRKIKALKDEVAKDLQFNIPDIVLPTLYEARRFSQQGGSPFSMVNGGGQYNDNRTITITVNGANADPNQIAGAIAQQLNQPPNYGVRGRLY